MEITHYDLRIVTPTVSAGADGKLPELRPSEFKGMMRFWYRAIVGERNLMSLKEEEGLLFGRAGSGANSRVSSVAIKLLNHPETTGQNIQKISILPHRNSNVAQFKAIMPGNDVSMDLLFHPPVDQNKKSCIEHAFYSALLLGGVGKRSRRGFGSIMPVDKTYDSPQSLRDEILCHLNAIAPGKFIKDEIAGTTVINRTDSKENPMFQYPVIRQIFVCRARYNTVDEALKDIGQATHDNYDRALGNGEPRMASPVVVSIKVIGGHYAPVVTVLHPKYPYQLYDPKKSKSFIRWFTN